VTGLRVAARDPLVLAPIDRPLGEPQDDEVTIAIEAAWVADDAPACAHAAGEAGIGRVTAAGEAARHLVGERVLIPPIIPCGECDVCRRGAVAACPARASLGRDRAGTLAPATLARARWLCPLGPELPLAATVGALVAGPAALAYSLYARCGLAPGQPAVAIGRGPIARIVARIAEAKGARVVLAAPDGDAEAIELALAAHQEAAGARRPRTVLDVGEPGGLALAARLAAPASTLVALAPCPDARAPGELAPFDVAAIARAQVTLLGLAGVHPDLVPELAALVVRSEIALDDLAEPVPWSAYPGIGGAHARARAAGRALVVVH
jgi:threonine dehydrogenase-like Zn-dependent dehydrogenase